MTTPQTPAQPVAPVAGCAGPHVPAGGTAGTPGAVAERETVTAPVLVITVFGRPITQGSKTRNRFGGVRDDNAETLHPWRDNVRSAALEYSRQDDYERIDGPVAVSVVFTFERPPAHWRTGRNAHLLRDNAPSHPISARVGDVDKAIRAVFDSLTDAAIWRDDALVVEVHAFKVYVGSGGPDCLGTPGAVIRVQAMT